MVKLLFNIFDADGDVYMSPEKELIYHIVLKAQEDLIELYHTLPVRFKRFQKDPFRRNLNDVNSFYKFWRDTEAYNSAVDFFESLTKEENPRTYSWYHQNVDDKYKKYFYIFGCKLCKRIYLFHLKKEELNIKRYCSVCEEPLIYTPKSSEFTKIIPMIFRFARNKRTPKRDLVEAELKEKFFDILHHNVSITSIALKYNVKYDTARRWWAKIKKEKLQKRGKAK